MILREGGERENKFLATAQDAFFLFGKLKARQEPTQDEASFNIIFEINGDLVLHAKVQDDLRDSDHCAIR